MIAPAEKPDQTKTDSGSEQPCSPGALSGTKAGTEPSSETRTENYTLIPATLPRSETGIPSCVAASTDTAPHHERYHCSLHSRDEQLDLIDHKLRLLCTIFAKYLVEASMFPGDPTFHSIGFLREEHDDIMAQMDSLEALMEIANYGDGDEAAKRQRAHLEAIGRMKAYFKEGDLVEDPVTKVLKYRENGEIFVESDFSKQRRLERRRLEQVRSGGIQ